MEHSENKTFSDKHGPDSKPDPTISRAISDKVKNNEISCAAAFKISKNLGVPPDLVGKTVDLLNFRLVKCQLGLFGYKPEKKVVKPHPDAGEDLLAAIQDSMVQGKLPCKKAWQIASRLGLSKMVVSGTCESLGVKVKPCQLGAF